MKLDKKQALLLSNVLFTHLSQSPGVDQLEVEDMLNLLNDFILGKSEVDNMDCTSRDNKILSNQPEKFDLKVSACELHDLKSCDNLEFEHDDEKADVCLLIDGYAEYMGVTAIKRTSKNLEICSNGGWVKHHLPKEQVSSEWRKIFPLGKIVLITDIL
jgi:hypothetical protein